MKKSNYLIVKALNDIQENITNEIAPKKVNSQMVSLKIKLFKECTNDTTLIEYINCAIAWFNKGFVNECLNCLDDLKDLIYLNDLDQRQNLI